MLTASCTSSKIAFEKAKKFMPGGVNSPIRACKALLMNPLVVKEASGSYIKDVDDNSYIDFCLSWGSMILGHSHPVVTDAIQKQMVKGTSYGALCEQEIELAERITFHIKHLEKIRFVSSGTEATMSALRLARGYTGRQKILKFSGNYHGHHDALLVASGSFLGEAKIPVSLGVNPHFIEDTIVIPYNDPSALAQLSSQADQIACVIFEPVCGNMGVVLPKKEFLVALESFCHAHGILIIVDEVMTGFRSNFSGATQDFQISGDLFCYGKIIGGGLPCAFFGGKQEIMDHVAPEGGVFQAGTLSGNPLAMAAGLAVTEQLLTTDLYFNLNARASWFYDELKTFIKNKGLDVKLNHYGSMFTLFLGFEKVDCFEDLKGLDQNRFNRFYKFLFEKGIYLSPSAFEASFLSIKHSEQELEYTLKMICQSLVI